MKKFSIFILLVIIAVVVVIAVTGKGPEGNKPTLTNDLDNASSTKSVSVTETTKVSSRTAQFQNMELGFAVNYPKAWEAASSDTGVTFIMPIDSSQVSTVAKLQGEIVVEGGKCTFPPVTTVKDRGTIAVGTNTLNMISMSNTVQGRSYFNRMYSLQKGEICYKFSFASITLSPQSKNLSGSNLIQAENNNKAIITASDADFTELIKSFVFVTGPSGQDETKVAPAPKVTATSTPKAATSTATSTRR